MKKLRPAVRLLPILAACLLTQGCVGLGVVRTQTKTFDHPSVGSAPRIYSVEACAYTNYVTAAWLQQHWGKPASIKPISKESGAERWTYKFGLACYGVMPAVVVPVPVVLPLGRQKIVFLMREGRVASADVVELHFSGLMWCMIGPDGSPVSYAEW